MDIRKTKEPHTKAFTLAVLVLCPISCAVLFILPFKVNAIAVPFIAILYIAANRPDPASFLCTLRPAVYYFAVLYITSAISRLLCLPSSQAMQMSAYLPVPYPLDLSLSIAGSSIICEASYTVTTDLERREALKCAVPALADSLSLLTSFIPLIRRVWGELNEARRNRGCALVSASILTAFISICMQKAIGTQEAMLARDSPD